MKRWSIATVVLLAANLAAVSPVQADSFLLGNGGRVEGKLLNPDESPRRNYVIETIEGGMLTLPNSQIARVVVKSEAERRYEAFAATLPDTVESHRDAARRCETAGLAAQREYHLEQVLRLDPNHEETRRTLGFSHLNGEWIKQDDFWRRKGYVRHSQAWRLPQEIALREAQQAEEQQTAEWRKKIKMWRGWIEQRRDRTAEGMAQIQLIRDPLAVPALVECLTRDKDPPQTRMLYVTALGEIGGPTTLVTFVRLVLNDRDPQIREACLDRLGKSGSKAAVRQFIKALQHDENVIVNRAAVALERMNDLEATMPLIDALITEHKGIVSGPNMSPMMTGDGGAGLSMGGGTKVVKFTRNNEPVLRTLSTLHVGVNFGFDQARWKAWYIDQNRPKSITNLRRSP
jgi:hypothetical protein